MRKERAQAVVFIAVALMALILLTVFVLVIGSYAIASEEAQSWTDAAVTGVFYDPQSIQIQYRYWDYTTQTVYRDPQDHYKSCDPRTQSCVQLVLRKKTNQCTLTAPYQDTQDFYAPDSDLVDPDPCGADVFIDTQVANTRMQTTLTDTWQLSKAEERGFEAPRLTAPPDYACMVERKGQTWLATIKVSIRALVPLNLAGSELLGQKGPVQVTRKASSDTELTLPGTIQNGQLKVFKIPDQHQQLCTN
ncbi:MAG: hypothetical protein KM310_07100 [Clostridiales bacterium]|nr:hypothetical protein [Clostridiales bacterium]